MEYWVFEIKVGAYNTGQYKTLININGEHSKQA